jgi:hypothetical protein
MGVFLYERGLIRKQDAGRDRAGDAALGGEVGAQGTRKECASSATALTNRATWKWNSTMVGVIVGVRT